MRKLPILTFCIFFWLSAFGYQEYCNCPPLSNYCAEQDWAERLI